MGTIDDYLAELPDDTSALFGALYAVAQAEVPEAEQGKGYGMPALRYRDKPLFSLMATKKHLSAFPFSAGVVEALAPELGDYDVAKGTIRFQPSQPLTPSLVRRLVELRRAEIEGTA